MSFVCLCVLCIYRGNAVERVELIDKNGKTCSHIVNESICPDGSFGNMEPEKGM